MKYSANNISSSKEGSQNLPRAFIAQEFVLNFAKRATCLRKQFLEQIKVLVALRASLRCSSQISAA